MQKDFPVYEYDGIFILNWILCRKEISQGAKLIYAVLCKSVAEDGICGVSLDEVNILKDAIGAKSTEEVKKFVDELMANNLLDADADGRFVFPVHRWMGI